MSFDLRLSSLLFGSWLSGLEASNDFDSMINVPMDKAINISR